MNDFVRFLRDNHPSTQTPSPTSGHPLAAKVPLVEQQGARPSIGEQFREDMRRQREAERRRSAARVAATPPADVEASRLAGQFEQQTGQRVPPPSTPEAKRAVQQQLDAREIMQAFDEAPITARWAGTLENAQHVRSDAKLLADMERVFADPWSVTGQVGRTLTAIPRGVTATLGSIRGGALLQETSERRVVSDIADEITAGAERLRRAEQDDEIPQAERELERTLYAQSLRTLANSRLTGAARERANDLIASLAEGRAANEVAEEFRQLTDEVRPAQDRPLFKAGEWIGSRLQESLAAGREYDQTVATQFGEGIGSLLGFMGVSAVSTLVGGPVAGLAASFSLAGMAGVDEQYERAVGAGRSHEDALRYAWQGMPAGMIQALSVEFLMRRIPIPVRRRASTVAKDLGASGLAEFTVETAGGIMQNIVQQQYDPSRGTFEDSAAQGLISGSGAATIRGFMLSFSGRARRGLFRDIERAEVSQELEQTFDALREGLEGSELRQAAPDRFREWATALAEGQQRETVYVSPEGLATMAEQLGDADALSRIIDVLPGVDTDSFEAAREQGTDLAVPTATWMTDVLGTDLDTMLAQHIRFDPEAMTVSERISSARAMQQEMQEVAEQVAALGRDAAEARMPPEQRARTRIYEDARARVAQAGHTASAADAIASQYAAFMARRAAVNQIPIDEFLRRFPTPDIDLGDTTVDMRDVGARRDAEEVVSELRAAGEDATLTEDAQTLQEVAQAIGMDLDAVTDMDAIREISAAVRDAPAAVDAPLDAAAAEGAQDAETEATAPRVEDAGLRARAREILDRPPRPRQTPVQRPDGEGPYANVRPTETTPLPPTLKQGMRQPDRIRDLRQWQADLRTLLEAGPERRGLPPRFQLRMGQVPAPLRALGVRGGMVGVDNQIARKILTKHIGVPHDFMLNFVEYVANPVAVLSTPGHETMDYLLVTSARNAQGAPIVVPFVAGAGEGRTAHKIPTAYPMWGEDDADAEIKPAWVDTARLVYRDEGVPADDRALHLPDDPFVGRERAEALAAKLNTRRMKNVLGRQDVVNITGLTVFQSPTTPDPDNPSVFQQSGVPGDGPVGGDFDTIRPEVVFGDEMEGDGLKFAGFFADVTEGTRQQPTRLVEGEVTYEGAIPLTPEVARFQETRAKYSGHFDQHIQTSIPGFHEVQAIVGDALAKAYDRPGVYMLDIGASEGALMKAVVERSEGSIFATALDPNPSMRDTFERMGGPSRVTFKLAAFGSREQAGQEAWTETHNGEEVSIPYFQPTGPRFDVVHEAMVFQFISNGRGAQVKRVKELMKPSGIAIFEQKFGGPADVFNANEARKDDYKAQYFTEDQLSAKRAEVLQTGGDAVEGMTDLQASQAEFEAVLKRHFKHARQFWSSGNFKGYIAGDDLGAIQRVLDNMQDTSSEYSVETTPRAVTVEVDTAAQTVALPQAVQHDTAPGRPQLPVRADGKVELHHWSNRKLTVIDPHWSGSGPLTSDFRRSGKKLSFFGIGVRGHHGEQATGYKKEAGLGHYHHIAAVDPQQLYPWFEDPDGLRAQLQEWVVVRETATARGRTRVSEPQKVDQLENMIREAGYLGYYVTEDGSGRAPLGNVAVLFDAVTPETAYDEDSGQVLFQSEADDAPMWYSALAVGIRSAKQARARPREWKAVLSKMPGVRRAELDWYGVDEWLDTRGDRLVTRDELVQFVEAHTVPIEEVVRSDSVDEVAFEVSSEFVESEVNDDMLSDLRGDMFGDVAPTALVDFVTEDRLLEEYRQTLEEYNVVEHADEVAEAVRALWGFDEGLMGFDARPRGTGIADAAEHLQQTMDGDIREQIESEVDEHIDREAEATADHIYSTTVSHPSRPELDETFTVIVTQGGDGEVFVRETGDSYPDLVDAEQALRERVVENADPEDMGAPLHEQFTEPGGENYREILLTVPDLEDRGPNALRQNVQPFVESGHFPEENIVMHLRVNDRESADGSTFFVEEAQGDIMKPWRDIGGQPPRSIFASDPTPALRQNVGAGMLTRIQSLRTALDGAEHWLQTVYGAQAGLVTDGMPAEVAAEIPESVRLATIEHAFELRFAGESRIDVGRTSPELLDHIDARLRDPGDRLIGSYRAWSDAQERLDKAQDELDDARALFRRRIGDGVSVSEATRLLAHVEQHGELPDAMRDELERRLEAGGARMTRAGIEEVRRTPLTPFEEQSGYELAAKRMLMEAARNNYDALAWTPGFMQAERWSGAVQQVVRRVVWHAPDENGAKMVVLDGQTGTDHLRVDSAGMVRGVEGGRISENDVVGRPLSALIGGQLADRVFEEDAGDVAADNIVIGGDGYKIAYDQQIKRFIEKFAKKHGSKLTVRNDMPDFVDLGRRRELIAELSVDSLLRVHELIGARPVLREVVAQRVQDNLDRERARAEELERDLGAWQLALDTYRETGVADLSGFDEFEKHRITRKINIAEQGGASVSDYFIGRIVRGNELLSSAREFIAQTEGDFDGYIDRAHQADLAKSLGTWSNLTRINNANQVRSEFPSVFEGSGRPVWYVPITEQMREAAQKPQPLFQRNRGKIVLPPKGETDQRPVITLFEGSDLSTLLHESGHYYLYVLQDLAEQGELRGQDAADWRTILSWWERNAEAVARDAGQGVTAGQVRRYLRDRTTGDGDVDRAINVGLQEQWARGLEVFFMEGNAPTVALRRAFENFKAWLTSIYRQATALNVNVSPEMREVFERMFAAEEEIAFARSEQRMDSLVAESAEQLGVSREEYQRLVDLSEEAREEAERRLLKDIMDPIRRKQTEEYRRERDRVRAEVFEEFKRQPVHRVREWIGNQRWFGEDQPADLPTNLRLDREQLVERYGAEILRLLPRGRRPLFSRRGERGASVDDVAGWFGFTSGDEMIRQLQTTATLDRAVDAEVQERMAAREPEPLDDAQIEDAARDAMHTDQQARLLAAEMRAIAKGGPPVQGRMTPRQEAREVARRTIRNLPVREAIRSHVYQAGERRAAQEAQDALGRGDRQGAFDAKRRQLMNHMLYSESKRAAEMVTQLENRVGRLRRKGTRENLAGEYLAAVDEIIDTYEFRRVSGRQLDRRGALRRYIEFMTEQGRENELAIPPDVVDQTERVNYKELTVLHAQGVLDSLKNIEHTARFKEKLRRRQKQRDLDETVARIVEELNENVPADPRGRVRTRADRRRQSVREYMNLTLKAGTILRKIGGFRDHSAAEVEIKREIDEGTRDLTRRRIDLTEKLDALYGVYSRAEMNRMSVKRWRAEADASLSKWDIISIALNMGNVDNLARLTDPDSRGFTRHQIDELTKTLDKRDWDFVQGMWDLIDSYWGEIAERERRLTGVAPTKVEAVPVETPHGTYRGGYYPIMYDGELSAQVNVEETQELMKNTLAGKFGKAQTSQGHLKERTGGSGGRPLMLGVEVAHRHLGRVIHDLALSEAVTNAWRVLQHPQTRGAFERAGLLQDLDTLEVWVQDVASGQLAAMDLPSRIFRRLKNNFTLAKLGLNLSTVMVQLTGIGQSAVLVGKRDFAKGALAYASAMPGHIAEVQARSEFMRRRQTTFNKDINDILNDVTVEAGPVERTYDRFLRRTAAPVGFWLMQKVQFYAVDMPTWVAVYQRDIADGRTEAEAVGNADAMVAQAQAGGEFADRSAFERGSLSRHTRQSDLVRIFTTLGSYMMAKANVAYERTGRASRVIREEGVSVRSAAEILNYTFDMATLFVVEAILYAAIMGRLPDEEEMEDDGVATAWTRFLARESAAGVAATQPFVRDIASVLQGFDPGGAYGGMTGEISSALGTMADIPAIVLDEERELRGADIRQLVRGVGLATGLPTTAANRVIDGFWRSVREGDEVAPIEYLMGRRE